MSDGQSAGGTRALDEAFAYFAKRDIPSALAHISRVNVDSDITHAYALELQGRCYHLIGKERDAAASFVATLLKLETCHQRDDALASSALAGLSWAAIQLPDASLVRVVETRYATLHWTPETISSRYIVETNLAHYALFVGDLTRAASLALAALQNSPSDLPRSAAYADLATISRRAGDRFWPDIYIHASWDALDVFKDRAIEEHDAYAILGIIAETSAYDALRARTLLARFQALDVSSETPVLRNARQARESHIQGLIEQAQSNLSAARTSFQKAYNGFRETEATIFTIESAYFLAMLGDEAMYWYAVGALAGFTNWMTDALKRRSTKLGVSFLTDRRHAILASLTPAQRDVARLVCGGKSNVEIARIRKTAPQTVKNMLTQHIFPAFGVSTRVDLRNVLSEDLFLETAPDTVKGRARLRDV